MKDNSIFGMSESNKSGAMNSLGVTETICFECLTTASGAIRTLDGLVLCQSCSETYYFACAGCSGLIPQDEALQREGSRYCSKCFAKSGEDSAAKMLSEEEVSTLISDFTRLHAEEKKIKEQLEEVKEKLKRHAASQPRVNNAVLLRAGEAAVKCGYSTRISYDSEKLGAVEGLLGAEKFAELFTREVKFTPVKDRLEEFLSDEKNESSEARAAIVASMDRKEIMTITPAASRGGAGITAKKK
jgi:hypothetical protein